MKMRGSFRLPIFIFCNIVAAIKSKIPSLVELGYKFFRKRHYTFNFRE